MLSVNGQPQVLLHICLDLQAGIILMAGMPLKQRIYTQLGIFERFFTLLISDFFVTDQKPQPVWLTGNTVLPEAIGMTRLKR